jgi:hypothetical protein
VFSKYRKSAAGKPGQPPELTTIEGGAPNTPATTIERKPLPVATKKPAQPAPVDKEKKRKERLGEIKLELHKRLLDNLNLSALEPRPNPTSGRDRRDLDRGARGDGVVLNREERQQLNQDLFDEVTGLGPLEPLLKDDTINDILVNGPQQVFVERAGKLTLTDTTFKDERTSCGSSTRSCRPWAGGSTNRTPTSTPASPTARASTRWCRRWRWTAASSRSGSSRRKSWRSTTSSASAPSPRRWRPTSRPRWPPGSTSSSRAGRVRARRPRSTRCRPSSTTPNGS